MKHHSASAATDNHHAPPPKPGPTPDPILVLGELAGDPLAPAPRWAVVASWLLLPLHVLWRGYVLHCGWRWLLVPTLGVPPLSYAGAVGLWLLSRYLFISRGARGYHQYTLLGQDGRTTRGLLHVGNIARLNLYELLLNGFGFGLAALVLFRLAALFV